MTERDAHLLANQLDPWIKTLTVVKDSILRVAKAEAEAKDWESRHTALVDDVALLKTERGLLKQEIDASKIRARAEAETIVKEALTQRDQMIEAAKSVIAPLKQEAQVWIDKIAAAKAEHQETIGELQRERETVSQQVRSLQESLRQLAGPLAKLAGVG